jgi:hypothetical protein
MSKLGRYKQHRSNLIEETLDLINLKGRLNLLYSGQLNRSGYDKTLNLIRKRLSSLQEEIIEVNEQMKAEKRVFYIVKNVFRKTEDE